MKIVFLIPVVRGGCVFREGEEHERPTIEARQMIAAGLARPADSDACINPVKVEPDQFKRFEPGEVVEFTFDEYMAAAAAGLVEAIGDEESPK